MEVRTELSVQITPRTVRRALVAMAIALMIASFIVQVLRFPLDTPRALGFVALFDADAEGNVPTFYSSLTLLACALLLGVKAEATRRTDDRYARHWLALSIFFLYIALDEAVRIHEMMNTNIASWTGVSVDATPWIAVAALVVLFLIVAFRDFARHLPQQVRQRALLGGAIFVGGALGVELVEAANTRVFDGETRLFVDALVSTLQELCEMVGVAFVLEALVIQLSVDDESVRLRFG